VYLLAPRHARGGHRGRRGSDTRRQVGGDGCAAASELLMVVQGGLDPVVVVKPDGSYLQGRREL
jgi:hypothetical protein